MNVPFLDLKKQYAPIREEIMNSIGQVFDRAAFAGGPFVQSFEENYAHFCGTDYAVAVNSGTTALWLALLAMDIGPGDEVITSANTFIATAEAISFAGATPVFVDVDALSYNLDPARLEEAITPRTRAIIPVHLFGQMADMDPIMDIARKHGLQVIEDASQAHGAEYKGRKAGSIGHAGCFSFYPGKNLGAAGEGGAIVTNDANLVKRMQMIRDHGQSRKYHHDVVGWNARMDGLQGAILNVKLHYLEQWNTARRRNARLYNELLDNLPGIQLPVEMDECKHVYHLYVIRTERRDDFMKFLAENGVNCGIHYPVPVPATDAYRFLDYTGDHFPVSEKYAGEIVSLPMFSELTAEQIEHSAAVIKQWVSKNEEVMV